MDLDTDQNAPHKALKVQLFLNTTDRLPFRASGAGRRTDVAIRIEVQMVRAKKAERRSSTKVADLADQDEIAVIVVMTRSRVPDTRNDAELIAEVHAFGGIII